MVLNVIKKSSFPSLLYYTPNQDRCLLLNQKFRTWRAPPSCSDLSVMSSTTWFDMHFCSPPSLPHHLSHGFNVSRKPFKNLARESSLKNFVKYRYCVTDTTNHCCIWGVNLQAGTFKQYRNMMLLYLYPCEF